MENLGVYIDHFMLFDILLNELLKALGIKMYISRICDSLDKQTRGIVVQTLVLNLVEYCLRIWMTTSDTVISSVQELQKFCSKGSSERSKEIWPYVSNFQEAEMAKIKADTCIWPKCNYF